MTSFNDLPETVATLSAAFGLDERNLPSPIEQLTLKDVHAFVAVHVERLLQHNRGRLMSILYRIDVAEPRVRHVLEYEPHESLAAAITDLIIERQLQKLQTRRRYRDAGND